MGSGSGPGDVAPSLGSRLALPVSCVSPLHLEAIETSDSGPRFYRHLALWAEPLRLSLAVSGGMPSIQYISTPSADHITGALDADQARWAEAPRLAVLVGLARISPGPSGP